jgi:hypothetical protein
MKNISTGTRDMPKRPSATGGVFIIRRGSGSALSCSFPRSGFIFGPTISPGVRASNTIEAAARSLISSRRRAAGHGTACCDNGPKAHANIPEGSRSSSLDTRPNIHPGKARSQSDGNNHPDRDTSHIRSLARRE